MAPQHALLILLFLPLGASIAIGCMPESLSRKMSILTSGLMVAFSLWILSLFKANTALQFAERFVWFTQPFPVNFYIAVDGLSLAMVLMTTLVTMAAVVASDSIKTRPKLYYSMLMLLTFSVLGVFVSQDLLQFFVMFELELIPMYILIAVWGGPRRQYAATKFLIYTFCGGLCMLAGLLYMYAQISAEGGGLPSFAMQLLANKAQALPRMTQTLACLGFFLAFIIKLPSFPFHTWLPDAHVEAPTPISMILAGVLLKMGSYGLVRICLGFFPEFFVEYGPWVMALGAFNIVWGAIACLVQTDMKRIIAFSSVSHMGFILLGLGALHGAALSGAIFQMVSHGFISAMLFFLVGTVYERCHTRQLPEIGGGLAKQMPTLFYFWMFATMANLGLPALSGFVGETAVFYGSYTSYTAQLSVSAPLVQAVIALACTGVILTAGYMLWLLKRLFYGPEQPKWVGHLSDATMNERLVGYGLAALILALGVYPLMLTHIYWQTAENIARTALSKLVM